MSAGDAGRRLAAVLSGIDSALVALSGGVDSAVLLAAAARHVPGRVAAATAVSPLQPDPGPAEAAARAIGAERFEVRLDPLADPAFRSNPPDRCLLCKRMIFSALREVARREGLAELLDGSNADDLGERRPGRRALEEIGARSPLAEAGLTEADVRRLARAWGLEAADLPADTCLATRFPYGTELTREGLERVGAVEAEVRGIAGGPVRVRAFGSLAVVEVAPAEIPSIAAPGARERIAAAIARAGFARGAVDLRGYRSGSMDEEVPGSDQNSV